MTQAETQAHINPDREQNKDSKLKRLSAVHRKIMDFCLDGWTNKAIAHEVEMTERGVGRVINSQLFQHELARRRALQEDTMQKAAEVRELGASQVLHKNSSLAAQTHVELMMNGSERVRLQAASEILDRTGVSRVQKVETQAVTLNISEEMLTRMQDTSREVFQEDFKLNTIPVIEGKNNDE